VICGANVQAVQKLGRWLASIIGEVRPRWPWRKGPPPKLLAEITLSNLGLSRELAYPLVTGLTLLAGGADYGGWNE
jgi:hypothetical protein